VEWVSQPFGELSGAIKPYNTETLYKIYNYPVKISLLSSKDGTCR